MKRILPILALLLTTAAHADWTVFGGVDHSKDQGNGTWWQSDYPYTEKLNSYVVGARYDSCSNGWCKGVGVVDLGKFSSSALADPSDADYAAHPIGERKFALSHYYGEGGTRGLFAAVGKQFGPWTIEVGVSALKPEWRVDVPDWHPEIGSPPQSISVSHRSHFQLAPMGGVYYRRDRWTVGVSVWNTASHGDEWVSLFKRTYALTLGYSF